MRRSTTRAARAGRSAALAGLALVAGLSVLSPSASSATDGHGTNAGAAPGRARAVAAHEALDHARAALAGTPPAQEATRAPAPGAVDPTMALRDLFVARHDLSGPARLTANRILARPTSPNDPNGDSYRAPSQKTCGPHVCVHWVSRTVDAPPSRAWVTVTLNTMEAVWKREVGGLGYRKPAARRHPGRQRQARRLPRRHRQRRLLRLLHHRRPYPAHLVGAPLPRPRRRLRRLRRSGARPQPARSPRRTSSSTSSSSPSTTRGPAGSWRRPPPGWRSGSTTRSTTTASTSPPANGQARAQPRLPSLTASTAYGNWIFFEFLSSRWGRGIVRTAWYDASGVPGAPNEYSIEAVNSVLASHGGLPAVYRLRRRQHPAGRGLPGGCRCRPRRSPRRPR